MPVSFYQGETALWRFHLLDGENASTTSTDFPSQHAFLCLQSRLSGFFFLHCEIASLAWRLKLESVAPLRALFRDLVAMAGNPAAQDALLDEALTFGQSGVLRDISSPPVMMDSASVFRLLHSQGGKTVPISRQALTALLDGTIPRLLHGTLLGGLALDDPRLAEVDRLHEEHLEAVAALRETVGTNPLPVVGDNLVFDPSRHGEILSDVEALLQAIVRHFLRAEVPFGRTQEPGMPDDPPLNCLLRDLHSATAGRLAMTRKDFEQPLLLSLVSHPERLPPFSDPQHPYLQATHRMIFGDTPSVSLEDAWKSGILTGDSPVDARVFSVEGYAHDAPSRVLHREAFPSEEVSTHLVNWIHQGASPEAQRNRFQYAHLIGFYPRGLYSPLFSTEFSFPETRWNGAALAARVDAGQSLNAHFYNAMRTLALGEAHPSCQFSQRQSAILRHNYNVHTRLLEASGASLPVPWAWCSPFLTLRTFDGECLRISNDAQYPDTLHLTWRDRHDQVMAASTYALSMSCMLSLAPLEFCLMPAGRITSKARLDAFLRLVHSFDKNAYLRQLWLAAYFDNRENGAPLEPYHGWLDTFLWRADNGRALNHFFYENYVNDGFAIAENALSALLLSYSHAAGVPVMARHESLADFLAQSRDPRYHDTWYAGTTAIPLTIPTLRPSSQGDGLAPYHRRFRNYNRYLELADDLHAGYGALKKRFAPTELIHWDAPLPAGELGLGYTLRPLHDYTSIVAEGERMQHCVGDYVQAAMAGEYYIFSIERQGDPISTLAFHRDRMTDEVEIDQHVGYANAAPPPELGALIAHYRHAVKLDDALRQHTPTLQGPALLTKPVSEDASLRVRLVSLCLGFTIEDRDLRPVLLGFWRHRLGEVALRKAMQRFLDDNALGLGDDRPAVRRLMMADTGFELTESLG